MAYNGGDSALASMTDPAVNTVEPKVASEVASADSPKNTTDSNGADLPKSGDVASPGTRNGVETSNEEETGTESVSSSMSANSGANNKNPTN